MDLSQLIRNYRINCVSEGHHHCSPGWIQLNCPFCDRGGSGWHLGLNVAQGNFSCWRCGSLPRRKTWEALGVPWEAVKGLVIEARKRPIVKPQLQSFELPHAGGLDAPHRKYLVHRGFDPDRIAHFWGVRGVGPIGHLRWRLLIPILWEGKTVSWTARSILPNAEQRYLSCPAGQERLPHKSILYGMDMADPFQAIVVEGPTDAWRLGPGTVATFGIKWTLPQLVLLSRFKRLFLVYDPEPVAQRQARKLADNLSVLGVDVSVVEIDEEDPGEMNPAQVRKLRRKLGFELIV